LNFASGARTLRTLTLNASSSALLGTALDIAAGSSGSLGTLTVGSGATLTTGGNLVLKSDGSGTARVSQSSGTVSGDVTVERFIPSPARRAWRLITAPLSNSNSIFDAWQNGGTYTSGIGTHITGPDADLAVNGLDPSGLNNPSLRMWDISQTFVNVTDTKTTKASPGNSGSADNMGYFAFVRGDRDPSLITAYTSATNTTTLSAKGKLQIGDQNFSSIASSNNEFTLIGNPYASAIDIQAIFANTGTTNLQRKIYTWDSRLNAVGGYVDIDDVDNSGSWTVNTGGSSQTQIIQSGQAFFVVTNNTGTPALQFKETNKVATYTSGFLRPLSEPARYFRTNLYLLEADNSIAIADGNTARFNNTYCACVDNFDNIKLTNVNETFGLVRNSSFLATERRPIPTISTNDTLFLRLNRSSLRSYQLHLVPFGLDPSIPIRLEDSYTNGVTILNALDTNKINFTINGDVASQNPDRFKIVFGSLGSPLPLNFTNVKAIKTNTGNNVLWTVAQQNDIKQYDVEWSIDGSTFASVYTSPVVNRSATSMQYTWLDTRINTNDIYYRIKSISLNGTITFSRIVKLSGTKSAQGITIYPNPVRNGVVGLQFNGIAAGKLQIELINSTGQRILQTQLNNPGGTNADQINLPEGIAKGMYHLKIVEESGKITRSTFIL
ncbi:MAG: T9SS type A sorting domain-containing protein, partial [Ferruginibacter sp.]